MNRADNMRSALRQELKTLRREGNNMAANSIADYLETAEDASLNRLAQIIAPLPFQLGEVVGATENICSTPAE